ncbi:hypothetical protein ASG56_12520 [Rhodococcus sp. Leaf7]|uniref:DUF2505 domain-containing protein n=1 Tax=unclassified Rhodococcus (in: high G+C Gram-positive bacteria) TaxID=192944 RepID=UPI0005AC4DAF|nr:MULTISPECIES: DUF2505 domain-containing protein [unclassified Rhodococcus (in: high G+C Gram-positive bacteria)]KIQ16783.1 hypothetical protein RU01_12635 [Rhodococcus sp. MEB064]KQU04212.1 hypothetical protein ASG56_12520 [Rhodococcus sp. Leaf7]KQU40397.1 hypothetical protein ASG64_12515 [Rhodococcus sp. Leaf247]
MARRMNYSARLPFTTEQVYAALTTRDYWDAIIVELRKLSENELTKFEVTADGVDVVMRHIIPRNTLPDVAQAVMKKDMVITRNIHHDAYSETTAGKYDASIPAGPGSLTGTTSLFATETGSTLRTTSEAKVYIPFIGGKLEQLMLVNLVDLWRGEGDVTHEWLTKNA